MELWRDLARRKLEDGSQCTLRCDRGAFWLIGKDGEMVIRDGPLRKEQALDWYNDADARLTDFPTEGVRLLMETLAAAEKLVELLEAVDAHPEIVGTGHWSIEADVVRSVGLNLDQASKMLIRTEQDGEHALLMNDLGHQVGHRMEMDEDYIPALG